MSKYHAVSSGMVTRQALPSITRQRGTVTGSADIMIYGAGKTTATNNITFLDSSANNFTVTRNGDTVQSGFNPFSQASAGAGYFDGTDDYLTVPMNTAFDFGSGNFTIEAFVYITTTPTNYKSIIGRWGGAGNTASWNMFFFSNTTRPGFELNYTGNPGVVSSSTALALNTWHHLALVRNGTTVTLYANGTSVATLNSVGTLVNGVGNIAIGTNLDNIAGQSFPGYISNARVVKGTAVYTSNFTPPTSPLTAITNTSLLLLMDNYVAVSSGALSYPLTNIGTTAPVISTAQFPTGMSSSIYFNGTGGLQTPVSANLAFGTGAYTMECWFYQISRTGSNQGLIGPTSTGGIFILQTTGQVGLWTGAFNLTSIGTSLNTWYHVAVVRQSNSQLNIYINGTSYYQTTNTTNYTTGAMTFGQDTAYLNGYMSNIRVVKGAAIYTSNFTVPSAPLPVNINVPAYVTNNIYGMNQIP
jgi:hypothetical protein